SIAGTVMGKVLFASFSAIQDSKKKYTQALQRSYAILFLTILPLSSICLILSHDIVLVLLGEKWINAVLPFQILIMGMVFRIGYKVGGTFLKGIGKVYTLTITQFLYMLFISIGSYIGIHWGEVGVAAGVTISLLLNFIILLYLSKKHSHLKWNDIFDG